MSDQAKLTDAELQEIRERVECEYATVPQPDWRVVMNDSTRILAHIDQITAERDQERVDAALYEGNYIAAEASLTQHQQALRLAAGRVAKMCCMDMRWDQKTRDAYVAERTEYYTQSWLSAVKAQPGKDGG
jgi:hypothetical protein